MFKKLLGIKKLEKNFKVVGDSLNRSWQWIDHFNKLNAGYEDRINRLERSNAQLIEVTRDLIERLQSVNEELESEPVQEDPEPQVVNVVPAKQNLNLPDKDLFLIRVIHQYAAFDKESSLETNTVYDNLTYEITKRGLRKKLNSLVDKGLLRTYKKGNSRHWYLNSGALAKVKKALKSND